MRENRVFIDRLLWVLGDRKLYPWGMALGFSSATLARLKRGNMPKGDTLATVARAENCCVSWLLTGQGHPFLVHRCDTDAETSERVRAYMDDEPWQVSLLHDTKQAVLALTLPAEIGEGGDAVRYTALELIAGAIGPVTAEVLRPCVHQAVPVSSAQIRAAQQGLLGTYEVLRLVGGGEDHGAQRVAELAAHYGGGAISADEQILVEKYRGLSSADRTHAQAVVGALAYAADKQEGIGK